MNRLTFNARALAHNITVINKWMKAHEASWTLVTKVLCGDPGVLKLLRKLGIQSVSDSRLENLDVVQKTMEDVESWYLRPPHLSAVSDVIRLADVSLNSDTTVITALNAEAKRQDRNHRIIIMVELGDLREGILPYTLVQFYQRIFELPNIDVIGIGANLGCLSGTVPTIDQFGQLEMYRELLELKFGRKLPVLSAGTSAVLPILLNGQLPKSVNHFRIGESVFLGTDLIGGGILPELRDDVVTLQGEITELREKPLNPIGEVSDVSPFEQDNSVEYQPGQRGYRALVTVGHLDTDVAGLTPVNDKYTIAGGSSDITVLNIGKGSDGLHVGDTVDFRMSYSALLRAMSSPYVEKVVDPSWEELTRSNAKSGAPDFVTAISPSVKELVERRASRILQ